MICTVRGKLFDNHVQNAQYLKSKCTKEEPVGQEISYKTSTAQLIHVKLWFGRSRFNRMKLTSSFF